MPLNTTTPTLEDLRDHGWAPFGACAKEDPEVMFPSDKQPEDVDYAKSVCRRCPLIVRAACIAAHDKTGDREGVWGARTGQEWHASKVAQRRAARRAETARRAEAAA